MSTLNLAAMGSAQRKYNREIQYLELRNHIIGDCNGSWEMKLVGFHLFFAVCKDIHQERSREVSKSWMFVCLCHPPQTTKVPWMWEPLGWKMDTCCEFHSVSGIFNVMWKSRHNTMIQPPALTCSSSQLTLPVFIYIYIRPKRHRRKKLRPSHRKLKPSPMKAASTHLPLLRRGTLMPAKQTPMGARKKGEFNGTPGTNMQCQLQSHQRAAALRNRSKQSERM